MRRTGISREAKKAKTRDALIESALALFVEKGFEGTTIEEIAVEAGISRRSFFRYFPTKESIAYPHLETRLAEFARLLTDRARGQSPLVAVFNAILVLAADLVRNREDALAHLRLVNASPALTAYDRRIDARWEDVIANVLQGDAEPATPEANQAQFQAAAVMGLIRVVLAIWRASDGTADLLSLSSEAMQVLRRPKMTLSAKNDVNLFQ